LFYISDVCVIKTVRSWIWRNVCGFFAETLR